MALFEPKAFDVQMDSTSVRAGGSIHGQIVARRSFSVSAFQMLLAQNSETVDNLVLPVSGRLSKGEALRFEVPIAATAAPSLVLSGPSAQASVDWSLMVMRGTQGMRAAKTVDVTIGPIRSEFEVNGFEHPEVLRMARNWERATSRSPLSLSLSKMKAEASGQNRFLVPESLNSGSVLQAPIAQWLGKSVSTNVYTRGQSVSVGLVCTLFTVEERNDTRTFKSFVLHEDWQEIGSDSSVELFLPRRGVPSYGGGVEAAHWTIEARGPNRELIERRPLIALASTDFDSRLIDYRPRPELSYT